MPQSSTIPVDGNDNVLIDIAASAVPLTVNGTIGTFATTNPAFIGVYSQSVIDAPGTVALNNYIALFNPVASGRLVLGLSLTASTYSTSTVSAAQSLIAIRITAQSGGTLVAAANVNRFDTNSVNPVTEVRIGNPSATTTGSAFVGFPPALGAGAQSPVTTVTPPSGTFGFFHPGQGFLVQVPVGNANQLWDIQFTWAEMVGS